jgi:hypothetical protein
MARSPKPRATKAARKEQNQAVTDEKEEKRLHRRALAQARAQKAKEILATVETDSDDAVEAIPGPSKQPSQQQRKTLTASQAKPEAIKVHYAFKVTLDNNTVIEKGKYVDILSKSRWSYEQWKETFEDAVNAEIALKR